MELLHSIPTTQNNLNKSNKPSQAQQKGPDVSSLTANALTLMKHGEHKLAANLFRQVLNVDPFNKVALKELAVCFRKMKRTEEAIKVLTILSESEPTFHNFKCLGDVAFEAEILELAKDNYLMALRSLYYEPSELFEVYKNLGNVFLKLADVESAEDFYNKAFTINPKDENLLVNLASLEIYKDQIDEAQTRFQQILAANSGNEKAWIGLALVHLKKNDIELAVGNLKYALDINPLNRTALQVFCKTAIQERMFIEATQYLQDYLSTVESDEEMSLVLVHLFCLLGQSDFAKFELERALLWNPTSPALLAVEKELTGA
jgi:tetratricopeptide (TPR) repeat protein